MKHIDVCLCICLVSYEKEGVGSEHKEKRNNFRSSFAQQRQPNCVALMVVSSALIEPFFGIFSSIHQAMMAVVMAVVGYSDRARHARTIASKIQKSKKRETFLDEMMKPIAC